MAAPARVRQGRGRFSKAAAGSVARQPACYGCQPVPGCRDRRLAVVIDRSAARRCCRQHRPNPSASNSGRLDRSASSAAGGRSWRRQAAGGSAVWPSPGPPAPAPPQEPPWAAVVGLQQVGQGDRDWMLPGEGATAGQALIGHHPQAIQVAGRGRGLAAGLLRREVASRAHHELNGEYSTQPSATAPSPCQASAAWVVPRLSGWARAGCAP